MTEDFKEDWYAFELEEFPIACEGRMVGELSWQQVDAVAAACISTFIKTGPLDKECLGLLDDAILRLAEMTALSEEEVRPYFEKLLDFSRQVREASAG